MKIVRIFGESLYSVLYENETADEFRRMFDLWQDIQYLFNFFSEHEKDLASGFWGTMSVDDAVTKTTEEAGKFERLLFRLSKQSSAKQNERLETLFAPLDNMQQQSKDLDMSKAKKCWLRIYGLRAEKNIYIVTGGAIKLTAKMKEREHTKRELQKLEKCRSFLLAQGLTDIEGIITELEL